MRLLGILDAVLALVALFESSPGAYEVFSVLARDGVTVADAAGLNGLAEVAVAAVTANSC